jgi:glycosyltransferase involved in cell wall biosynthesis
MEKVLERVSEERKGVLKIISIVTSFPRNENDVLIPWIIRLIKELKSRNIETAVFTSSYCGLKNELKEGTEVRRFRYFFKRWEKLSHDMSVPEKLKSDKRYFLVLPFFMLFGVISAFIFGKKNDFDVIHVHFPFPLALFGIAMKIASKKPMIVSCHGSEVNMAKKNIIFRAIFRWMMKRADGITVNSGFMKNELKKIIGNREIEIIPMGSGVGEIFPDKREKNNEKTKILYVGRLIKLKGVKHLIDAFQKLDPSQYELHIVGDGPERSVLDCGEAASSREKLEVRSEKGETPSQTFAPEGEGLKYPFPLGEGAGERSNNPSLVTRHSSPIHFHGYLTGTDLQKMYQSADIFVLPSIVDDDGYTEGLGTVLLEAISHGVPVIGTNVGGIPDIIIDGETGFLVPQKNPDSIAQAIEKIVNNPELAEELTKNAKKHLARNFSWKMITDRFAEVYGGVAHILRK